MNLTISGHQLEVTDGIGSAVRNHIACLKQCLADATRVNVLFTGARKNGHAQSIQISVHLPGKKEIVIKKFSRRLVDFYTTIHEAFLKLKATLNRCHDGIRKAHTRRTPAKRLQVV